MEFILDWKNMYIYPNLIDGDKIEVSLFISIFTKDANDKEIYLCLLSRGKIHPTMAWSVCFLILKKL